MDWKGIEKILLTDLDPARLAGRAQAGKQLKYLETWDVIATANRIFGFDGWQRGFVGGGTHKVAEREFLNEGKKGWEIAYLCEYYVQVGNQRAEDIGYGNATSYRSALDCHELAAKEAVSDALKRCFRSWGNQFGNALYDKGKTHAADTHEHSEDDSGNGDAPAAGNGQSQPGTSDISLNQRLMALIKEKKKTGSWAQIHAKKIDPAVTKVGEASDEVKQKLIAELEKLPTP